MRTDMLLLDGDILVHKMCLRAQREVDWGQGILSLYCDSKELLQLIDRRLQEILEIFGAADHRIALSDYPEDGLRWREEIMPTYKGQRHSRKPLGFFKARDYLMEHHKAEWRPKLEGDDLLGVWATGKFAGDGTVVLSEDKDLQTIPCRLARGIRERPVTITEVEADHYHLVQTLTGDTIDGYKGCPGVGPKKVEKILGKPGDRTYTSSLRNKWAKVVEAYKAAGLTREDALLQARVARILRADEYDHRNKKVRLWQTPK